MREFTFLTKKLIVLRERLLKSDHQKFARGFLMLDLAYYLPLLPRVCRENFIFTLTLLFP